MVGDADFLKQFRFWSRDERFSVIVESACQEHSMNHDYFLLHIEKTQCQLFH